MIKTISFKRPLQWGFAVGDRTDWVQLQIQHEQGWICSQGASCGGGPWMENY